MNEPIHNHDFDCHKQRNTKSRPWTIEEDNRLICCIQKNPTYRWKKVSDMLGRSRTATQCCQRWHRLINPRVNGTGWNEKQDQVLLRLVQVYGTSSWTRCSKYIPDKTDIQCRLRYIQILRASHPIFHPIDLEKRLDLDPHHQVHTKMISKALFHPNFPTCYPINTAFISIPPTNTPYFFYKYIPIQKTSSLSLDTLPLPQNSSKQNQESYSLRDPRMEIKSLLS